ncbi:MAG: polysaccharide deacetylase family protein, partial [Natronospirillum sp.]
MPEPVGPFRQSLAVKHGSAVGGRVYLTFDDGPDATWTPRILDALAERDAHATFFMIGQQVLARKSIARRVLAEGHEIGNHSWSHRHPWLVDAKTAQQEVRDGSAAIA